MGKDTIWKIISTALISALLAINAGLYTSVKLDLKNIDAKIFHHLTNDEIHIPREYVVPKAEFDMVNNYQEKQRQDVLKAITEIKSMIQRLEDNTRKK